MVTVIDRYICSFLCFELEARLNPAIRKMMVVISRVSIKTGSICFQNYNEVLIYILAIRLLEFLWGLSFQNADDSIHFHSTNFLRFVYLFKFLKVPSSKTNDI